MHNFLKTVTSLLGLAVSAGIVAMVLQQGVTDVPGTPGNG